ncbi:hypothetical protein FE257_008379 [Aspergillus nanangensis]|uniref:F-box domain protein n=1 Tax=Aspergillus nanangensis TaxID=2582783 RepID=A0AAD4CM66_ASPNN|nr:hypothetical protein FE257_008379 [Aspergillus nanangensis]
MDRPRRMDDLADELINDILSFLLDSERPSNDNAPANDHDPSHGSNGSPKAYGEQSELDRFRLVCQRFMRIGTPRKFPRFVLRFSRDGFQRLEDLLSMQLAGHIRYFTYMVRPFYQGSGWSDFLNGVDSDDLPASHIHKRRFQEQQYIVERNHDLVLLRRAISAFSSLQQIKLLRLQDGADEQVLDHVREQSLQETVRLDWEPACTRAVTSLGVSLLESSCTSVGFVGPQMSPEATVRLSQTPKTALTALGARLTSLDVTFHSAKDMETRMGAISDVFHDFFLAAKNLTAIHLGFPAHRPLDLSLEQIFHHVIWKGLRTLSIQGWRLRSSELISLIRRHRHQLRDIRLTSIYLHDDQGQWRDVLAVLHDEMDHLERIDLREIDYAVHSDSRHVLNSNGNGNGHNHQYPSIVAHPAPDLSPRHIVLNIDYMFFAPRGHTRRSFTAATLESLQKLTADDLGDDGLSVHHEQRVFWEAWVLSSSRNTVHRRF